MKKKAVIFDMDGLMFDTEKLGYQAQGQLVEELSLSIPFDFDYYLNQVGRSDKDVFHDLVSDIGDPALTSLFQKRTKETQAAIALDKGIPVKAGLHELLLFLEKEGIACVVASSSKRKEVAFYLELAELTQYFKYQICGDEVAFAKPNPEIFLRAWEPLGFAKEECLILEDSLNGIRAAYDAAIDVIMVPDLIAPNEEAKGKTLAILPDLHAVMAWLKDNG